MSSEKLETGSALDALTIKTRYKNVEEIILDHGWGTGLN